MRSPEGTPEERAYAEAGEWVRMVNTVVWSMGSLATPVSFTLLGFGARYPSLGTRVVLAIASVSMFGLWVYASWVYGATSRAAREVLTTIESGWGLGADKGTYLRQAPVLVRGPGIFRVQLAMLAALVVLWLALFATRFTVADPEDSVRSAPAAATDRR